MRGFYGAILLIVTGCGVIEKSSRHEFDSGHYRIKRAGIASQQVYVNLDSGRVDVHTVQDKSNIGPVMLSISMEPNDSLCHYPVTFYKSSLDIDLTTVLLKYRFATPALPMQLNTDFNGALYFGWRHDWYKIRGKTDPLGICRYQSSNRGFDIGLLAGLGSTQVTPFTTGGIGTREYNAPIIQYGLAAFIESNVASFGMAVGYDHLLGSERNIWIYRNKPWLGFVVGLALN